MLCITGILVTEKNKMSAPGCRDSVYAKGATMVATTQSEKALLIQKFSPQAQRISSIMENCISHAEIAAALPAVLQSNTVSSVVNKELSGILQEHQLLAEKLEALEGLKQESHEECEENAGEAKAQLHKDIKNSVRDVLRYFRAHPDAICELEAEIGMEIGESEDVLIRGLKMFHSHIVETLQPSLDEELQLPVSEQAQNMKHIISLEEVAAAIKHLDTKISQKNNEIEALRCCLQDNNTQEGATPPVTDKQDHLHVKTSNMKQTKMQQEIDQLKSQLYNLMVDNRQAERKLQENNEKLELEIEYLLRMFDEDMENTQANLELNEQGYEEEQEEVRKLEKPFSILEEEYNQIQERRQLAGERRKEEMKELELKTKAAILAQAWWRGYSTRKALKNKGKSKKAKKGKGKKTK